MAAHSFTAIALYGGGQVSAAWTLTVTANNPPTITKAIDSKGATIVKGGFTIDTQITLSGAGAKGQKVQIKDGTTVKGEATVNLTTGLWELTLTGLSVAAHSFTAIALYGSGQVSAAWTLTVTASNPPTITRAEDSKGVEILPDGTTFDTTVTLKGKGAKGQKVLIKDGTTVRGTADVDPQSGDWEFTVTALSVASHPFTATALYGGGEVSNPPRIVVVANLVNLVEDFMSYPPAVILQNPGDSRQGNNTTITVNEVIGAGPKQYHAIILWGAEPPRFARTSSSTNTSQNILSYSLALKQGGAKSVIINGRYSGTNGVGRMKLEFRRKNIVIDSTVLYEGTSSGIWTPIYRELAPANSQVFDTLKFEFTKLSSLEGHGLFDIYTVTFKS
ncbi:hypothetical protein EMIT093MI4_140001 [Pseudomonas sp. IT-93MI4]